MSKVRIHFGLKIKILFGFALLSFMVFTAFIYGAWTFHRLERRMEVVNDLYVPALKALNQIESSFFLLESDLDKSFQEGILRPKDTLESILNSRLDFLQKLDKDASGDHVLFSEGVKDLITSFKSCDGVLSHIYQDWSQRTNYEAELSQKRSDFRLKLKSLVRDLDRETRLVSVSVQGDISRLGIALIVILGFCFTAAFLLVCWLARSLRPMETLAGLMREISEKGLSDGAVRAMAQLPLSHDEVGTLSRESYKMAASLLDKNKLLESQKLNLERAHTEMARQNIELKKAQTKLLHSEKLGLVGRMAAQMAHEIRNPLNALNLHAEMLEDQVKNDKKMLEGVTPLRKEINRLISVTESYLDLARAPRLEMESVQLNEVIEELHELYEPLFREKGIFFTCDLGDVPLVAADRGQFTQVLGNLLKNASEAFEACEKNKGRFIRLITQLDENSEVILTIMDNGAGIPPELQQNIFSPFFTSKAQGTGLGLAFSKQVVEAHGGDISFDSDPTFGTKFTVRMPVNSSEIRR